MQHVFCHLLDPEFSQFFFQVGKRPSLSPTARSMVHTDRRAVVEQYLPFVLASHTKRMKDSAGLERHMVIASMIFPINPA